MPQLIYLDHAIERTAVNAVYICKTTHFAQIWKWIQLHSIDPNQIYTCCHHKFSLQRIDESFDSSDTFQAINWTLNIVLMASFSY